MRPTASAADLGEAEALLVVTPAQTLRSVLITLRPQLRPDAALVLCAKGIERGTDAFLTDVAAEAAPGAALAVLSGPSFAADVARGLPTAVTLASRDGALAARLAAALSGPTFRVYHGSDPRGVEIGGAAKNVLAIACGAAIGRASGKRPGGAGRPQFRRADAFCPRLGRLPRDADGAVRPRRPRAQRRLVPIAQLRLRRASRAGASLEEASGGKLAEGALTAQALVALARRRGVEMPVAEAVAGLLSGALSLDAAIADLLSRPLRAEV